MIRSMFAVAAAVLMAVPAAAAETKYALTGENTKLEFVGTKANGKHVGGFKKLSGTATAADGGMAIEAEIDCDSLYTDDPQGKLTQHLKSPDFFAVKDHPTAKFKSTCSNWVRSARTHTSSWAGDSKSSMSSPISRRNMRDVSSSNWLRLKMVGAIGCWRLNAKSWRVSPAPRSTA